MARGSLLIQHKKSMAFFTFLFSLSTQRLSSMKSFPKSPPVNLQKRCCEEEVRRGGWRLSLPGARTSEEWFRARKCLKKNQKHLTFPLSLQLKILTLCAFTSHHPLADMKKLCKYEPLHIFLIHFVFLSHHSHDPLFLPILLF